MQHFSVDFELLRLTIEIADQGSIAAAARKLGMTPSAASRKLAYLEQKLEARLFIRTTRHLELTATGAVFLGWCRQSTRAFENVVDQIASDQRGPVGLLRIACNDYMGPGFVAGALAAIREEAPRIQFVLTLSDDPIAYLAQGYDVVVQSGSPPADTWIGRKVTTYQRVLCAHRDYVARHGSPERPDDLVHHSCLVHSRTDTHEWVFREPGGDLVRTKIARAVEVNSYPLLLDLARRGMGIIRIADVMAQPHLASGELVTLMPDYPCCEPDGSLPGIWLAYPTRDLPSRTRTLVEELLGRLRRHYESGH